MMDDLFDLSVEIDGISAILSGLANQLDNNETDTLTPTAMRDAIYGVQRHLNRISSDLEELSKSESEPKEDAA